MILVFRNILLLSLLLLTAGVKAQTYFNKSYTLIEQQNSTSVLQLPTGYLTAGQEITTTYRALFFVRTDLNGDTLWTKKFPRPGYAYYTGLSGSLIPTSDGGFALGGSIIDLNDTVNTGDVILVKLDVNCDTMWTRVFGGPYFDAARICQQTLDGGYILIGDKRSTPNAGTNDFYLVKTDAQGNLQWERTYSAGAYEVAFSGQQTFDKGYILSGTRTAGGGNYSHYVVKVDSTGQNVEWTRTYGSGNDNGGCFVTQTSDSGYVLAGALAATSSNKDACIRKIDKDGIQEWLTMFPTPTYNSFYARAIELWDGSIVAAGTGYNSQGIMSGYMAKVDADGNETWQRWYNKYNLDNYFYDIKSTADNGFILAGMTVQPVYTTDAWLVKVDSMGCPFPNCAVGIDEAFINDEYITAYPNPSNGVFTIRFPAGEEEQAQVRVMNSVGQEIRAVVFLNATGVTIDIVHLPAGIYLVKITTPERSYYARIVKQ